MKTLDLFGFAHERGINEMFYANFRYKYWPEKTKIRFIFEQNRKNETFRSQKNETLTSLVVSDTKENSWHLNCVSYLTKLITL
jgi:hypothetical protein